MYRAAIEAELLPQPPLDESPVAGLQETGREQHEMRRPDARLRREKDLGLPAAPHRRRGGGGQLGEPGVEPAGRHPRLPAGQRQLERGDQPVQMPSGGSGYVDPRRPAGGVKLPVDLAVQLQPALLVDQIPLVVGDDQCPARLYHHGHDPQVLLGERLAGVDQHDRDLGAFQRPRRPQRCVEVGALALAGPAPDPGGIDEPPADAAELDQFIHRVTGGARHRVHQDPVLARQLVEQAGLPHVRAADESHPARSARPGQGLGRRLGQRRQHGVEQVAAPPAVQRAHRPGLPEPECPQRRRGRLARRVVHLVRRDHHRLARAPQHRGDGIVGVGDADGHVHDEQHRVGRLHRQPGLRGHLLGEGAAGLPGLGTGKRLPAAGVDQGEGAPAPEGVIGHPVAGDAWRVLHHRLAAAENPVDQGGLADVGPADDRQHRSRDVLLGAGYLPAGGTSGRFRICHGHPVRAGSAC